MDDEIGQELELAEREEHEFAGERDPTRVYPHNLGARCDLNPPCDIELADVAKCFINSDFRASKQVVKIQTGGKKYVHINIYRGGQINVAGYVDMEKAQVLCKQVAKRIKDKLNVPIRFSNFSVSSVMGVGDVGVPVNLNLLAGKSTRWKAQYDTTFFSGVKLTVPVKRTDLKTQSALNAFDAHFKAKAAKFEKLEDFHVDVRVSAFTSGKANVAGGVHPEVLQAAWTKISPHIKMFERRNPMAHRG
uniref:Uncharacterized protein n=1 Tax=Chromera velia CCMP2878 TaxID=1169474 RepID=A0A0G4HN55_9ALVE|eukprot:Cvel_1171.t1-p1 / transcript=Cvel_1171.t1 / gene=Cvel_1171 / organism=Chromera_velia_CCMP2878 / gene_product=hypothetical protein / transcript_product=hypothetical protein / location=Cvel_scaffold39:20156-20893(-) / protein_length=246 / sequence_SO=supercontig / SO=protein_coding / is_pseudo=false